MTEKTPTAEAEKPTRRWGRAEWGPLALLVGHVVVIDYIIPLLMVLLGKILDRDVLLLISVPMGATLAQPMLCALWAAWAPSPLITRIPTALTALVLLGFFATTTISVTITPLDIFLSWHCLFVFYWVWLAAARRAGRGALTTSNNGSIGTTSTNQFSLRYLLFWTTIVAFLMMIGSYTGAWEEGDPTFSKPVWKSVGTTVLFSGIISLLLFPVFASGIFVLRASKHSLVKAAKKSSWFLLFYTCMATVILMTWESYLLSDIFFAIGNFYLGAMLSMALSALVLRYSGYRITRD